MSLRPLVLTLSLLAGTAHAGTTAIDDHAAAHPAGALALDALPAPTGLLTATPRLVQPWAGGTVVRVGFALSGLPVENREQIVVLGTDGAVRRILGEAPGAVWIDPRPSLAAATAIDQARAAVAPLWASEPVGTPRTELVAVIEDASARLAWAVDQRFAEPLSTWRVLVDARDGSVLRTNRTSWDADGNVYGANPDNSEPERVELPNLTSDDWLTGTYAHVQSCDTWVESGGDGLFGGGECTAVGSHASPDGDGHYLYTIDAASLDDPMAEVQMYYHLDKVAAWFDDTLGFAHGEAIEGIVNFEYRNAFFGDADDDGRGEVAFGQFGQTDFAYDSDVIAHEYVHSVISRVVQAAFVSADEYGVEWAPGSLNEGSADLFSVALYGDPVLGEYAGAGFGSSGAVRDLDDDRRCPHDLYGESHRDGLIWGSLGWNLIEDPLLGPELTATLVFGATLTWPSDVTWDQAGQSLLDSADDLLDAGTIDADQRAAIEGHATAAGVVDCVRVIPLDEGAEAELLLVNLGATGDFGRVPATAQMSIEAPENARDIRLRVRDWRTSSTDMGWVIYGRRGGHVVHAIQNVLGVDFPVPEVYDFTIEGTEDGVDIVIGEDTIPQLEPGATYYFSVASDNLGGLPPFQFTNAEITISGDKRLHEDSGDDDDAAGDDDDDGGDGCASCGSSVAGSGGSVLALFVVGGLLRRRR